MKIYNTQEEVEKDIVNGMLNIDDDVIFNCNIDINIDITAYDIDANNIKVNNININNIKANNIMAYNITASDIKAYNIDVNDINAYDIDANNIKVNNININNIKANNIMAYNITASDIKAYNIDVNDINANNIDANNINYYAICSTYNNIKCSSIKGRKINSKHFCLDGKITITQPPIEITTKDGQIINITKEKAKELGFNIN